MKNKVPDQIKPHGVQFLIFTLFNCYRRKFEAFKFEHVGFLYAKFLLDRFDFLSFLRSLLFLFCLI